ncbi:MAG: hypothetical protein LBU97_04085 [Alistipes sp.]|jgi:hypothetical protein|nr:hypothetical protein [Alistipes sp.]
MKTLITPAQVAAAAFRAPDMITPEAVPEATILAAEQKFIRPVLGAALCDAMGRGEYPDLLENFVKLPLALWVKSLMLPSLALQTGTAGVVEANSKNLARAGEGKIHAAIRRLRGDARALMRRAVEQIEASPDLYPDYSSADNVLNHCSMEGGVVINK